jgi:DNA-nicking Smr family endonuclease
MGDVDGTDDAHHVPIEGSIDLHAFAPRDVRSVVEAYIEAAAAAGFREVRVIHGRGRGVQRGLVQAVLDAHPDVEEFRDDTASHLGATLVRIKPRPASTPDPSP